MNINKPFSESCIQNQDAILAIIKKQFNVQGSVLEIGSGTGQHAIYFAQHCQNLTWTPSDVSEHLGAMQLWFDDVELSNLKPSVAFNINNKEQYPADIFNYMFTANTVHIMSWQEVEKLYAFVGKNLAPKGKFINYGPFNYNGEYTSESNRRFDGWLNSLAGDSSIKDFVAIQTLADINGLTLVDDVTMPANNRCLVWQKN